MRRARLAITGLLAAALWLGLAASSVAKVTRPAPDFSFAGVGGKKGLRTLRGQPVVLVVSKSPKSRAFRKQLKNLRAIYQEFASRKVVFVAAFSEEEGEIPSNIPFVIANNGPGTASAYDLKDDIIVAIIGRDGNLDMITDKVLPALRIREVIQNSFEVQNSSRKETPKRPPQP
jgi:hypothetical protein